MASARLAQQPGRIGLLAPLLALSLVVGCAHPREAPAERRAVQFQWPLQGRLSSGFGSRGSGSHRGIDILAPRGTRIKSAAPGKVSYSGKMRGFGNVVIIQHDHGYETVYGHNHRNLVSTGARVARGDVIAQVGSTGNATTTHLHFEVRVLGKARDPLAQLPRSAR